MKEGAYILVVTFIDAVVVIGIAVVVVVVVVAFTRAWTNNKRL